MISSLPGSVLRTHVESLGKPRDVNKRSQSLVNLISKDTHLVFSIYYTSREFPIQNFHRRTTDIIQLSYTYTSIALDTTLLAQAYQPSQIELSSPGIQKSCRGLIPGLIPGLEVIKLEYSLRLKIKRNDWLLADTCLQAANHWALF